MCDRPISLDTGVKVSCRTCDACLSTKMQHWVARCMAEASQFKYVYALTLTYSERTERSRRGARSFRYSDVSDFNKRLARQTEFHNGARAPRFVVTGENGDKKGRVHWHMLVFHDFDITQLGEWFKYGKKWNGARKGRRNRLDWSLWPHGFVEIQEPNDNGVAYVLKYAFKDQFTNKRAKGTNREGKAVEVSTGLFRMSKGYGRGEAIGEPWLHEKVDKMLAAGQFPVSFDFKVPNYWGYWHVNGVQRRNLLDKLKKYVASLDYRPPQFSALLSKMTDRERLEFEDGQEAIEEQDAEHRARDREFAFKESTQRGEFRRIAKVRKSCGNKTPCSACCARLDRRAFDKAVDASRERSEYYLSNPIHPCCGEKHVADWAYSPSSQRLVALGKSSAWVEDLQSEAD